MNRHAPRAAGAEPAPQPQPSAQSQNQSQSQSQSHSQSNGAAPDEAEIDPRRAASAAFERRMSAAGRPVRPAPEPAAITLGAEWTPLQRRRRQDRRIRALVAYGAGAVALVVTVGVVLGVVQRRADISIAARAAPPVESPAALPPEPMAPLPSVEAADGGLRGAAEVAEPPRVAMVRIDGQSATAPSAAPPRRRAPVRAAEPPIITPPPPATVPSPLDEPEALLLDIAPTPAQPATPMASPAP